jgi:aminocarboxymuconate-semialdehyde decarboxylase
MKRIDAFTHFFPKGYYDLMGEVAGHMGDMVRRARRSMISTNASA